MPKQPDALIPDEGLTFLSKLRKNNTTEWFHMHKEEYGTLVRDPMASVVQAVNRSLESFAPEYVTTKKDPLSRPNRDTRFSKDKSPYRSDIAVVFPRSGLEKQQAAGFFLRVGPEGAELIAGSYMPGPDELRKFRSYVAAQHATFRKLTTAKPLASVFGTLLGERLVRVPAPYPGDHPAAEFLRMKQVYYSRLLSPEITTSNRLVVEITTAFRAATPFVVAVDKAFGN